MIPCSGRQLPSWPLTGEGLVLPLGKPWLPLQARPVVAPPLEDARVRQGGEAREEGVNLVVSNSRLSDPRRVVKDYHTIAKLSRLLEEHYNDPYGPENSYSGPCVAVVGDLVLHTQGPRLLVSRLGPDPTRLLPRAPLGPPTLGPGCRPLAHTPVFSLDTRQEGGVALVLAKHTLGAALSRLGPAGGHELQLASVRGLPCSKGCAAASLLPLARAATLDQEGQVLLWDVARGQASGRFTAGPLLEGGKLRWGWGLVGPGLHPLALLLGDRGGLGTLDTRAETWGALGMALQTGELLRGAKEGRGGHTVWAVTDSRLLLSDLRQPKAPVLAMEHSLGGPRRAPVSGLALGNVGSQEWVLAYTRWGHLALTCTDWGHSSCTSWAPVNTEDLSPRCGGMAPRVLGARELGGWGATLARARGLGGEWLDPALEERSAVPFTGFQVVDEHEAGVVVYGATALGDLVAKQLLLQEVEQEDKEVEQEVVSRREEVHLERWGCEVADSALLPKIKLMANTYLVQEQGSSRCSSSKTWALPVLARERSKGGPLLPKLNYLKETTKRNLINRKRKHDGENNEVSEACLAAVEEVTTGCH